MDRNDELFQRAQISIPGGVNSPVRAFRSVGGSPRFIDHAKGPYMWDATGKQFIDYILSWGPMILGHNNDDVIAAVDAAVSKGLSFGAVTEGETLIAEEIRKIVPSMEQVRAIVADVRVAGMLTGKTGFLHVHLGDYPSAFDIFDAIVESGLPIKHIRPTHVARHPKVFERAMAFAKKGGMIDITTGGGCYMGTAADAVRMALENDVPLDRITLSSDGHGSMPRFNEAGEMVGLATGKIRCDIEAVRDLAKLYGLETALRPMTTNIARALGLPGKGEIAVGNDADLLFMTDDFNITDVFRKGQQCMKAGEVIVKGAFED